jgi:ribonuclease P protein component
MAQTRPRACAFPRALRIRKRAEFVRIQAGGRRATARRLLVLVAARRAEATPGTSRHADRAANASRLGLVASRKVGGAVARNRAKRLVREAFRTFPELFPEHVDIVVILRSGAGSLGLADVVSELRALAPVLRRRAREALADACATAGAGVAALTPAAPRELSPGGRRDRTGGA